MSWVLMNISPSYIFPKFALRGRYGQTCQFVLAAPGMNGLKSDGDVCMLICHSSQGIQTRKWD